LVDIEHHVYEKQCVEEIMKKRQMFTCITISMGIKQLDII